MGLAISIPLQPDVSAAVSAEHPNDNNYRWLHYPPCVLTDC